MNEIQASDTMRFLGRLLLLRHGQTDYTDKYPDLTREGKITIRLAAEKIDGFIAKECDVKIITSPATRAKGSADIIADTICFEDIINIEPLLGSAQVYDKAEGKKLFEECMNKGGYHNLSLAYNTDPRFEDGVIFEPRTSVQKRFAKWLLDTVRGMLTASSAACFICVSHYEVLYLLVEKLFNLDYKQDLPLSFGEIIDLTFFQKLGEKGVRVKAAFRGKTVNTVFEVKPRYQPCGK